MKNGKIREVMDKYTLDTYNFELAKNSPSYRREVRNSWTRQAFSKLKKNLEHNRIIMEKEYGERERKLGG